MHPERSLEGLDEKNQKGRKTKSQWSDSVQRKMRERKPSSLSQGFPWQCHTPQKSCLPRAWPAEQTAASLCLSCRGSWCVTQRSASWHIFPCLICICPHLCYLGMQPRDQAAALWILTRALPGEPCVGCTVSGDGRIAWALVE